MTRPVYAVRAALWQMPRESTPDEIRAVVEHALAGETTNREGPTMTVASNDPNLQPLGWQGDDIEFEVYGPMLVRPRYMWSAHHRDAQISHGHARTRLGAAIAMRLCARRWRRAERVVAVSRGQ